MMDVGSVMGAVIVMGLVSMMEVGSVMRVVIVMGLVSMTIRYPL